MILPISFAGRRRLTFRWAPTSDVVLTAPRQLLGNAMLTGRDSPFARFAGVFGRAAHPKRPRQLATTNRANPTRPGTQLQLVARHSAHPFPIPDYTAFAITIPSNSSHSSHTAASIALPLLSSRQGLSFNTAHFPNRLSSYGSDGIFFPIHDSLSEVPLI